jgi:predicted Na+-dependent transporter
VELSDVTSGLVQASGVLFVVASMLAMGLSLTVPMILKSVANARLMGMALIANFVVVPALAFGAAQLLISDSHPGLRTGLILIGAAAGAPFLPKLVQTARGPMALGVGLMVVLMLVTIVYLPVVLPLLLPGDVAVDSWQIAKSLIFLMLLPLGIGLLVRARYQDLAGSMQPVVAQVSTVAVAFLMVSLLVINFESIIGTVGTGGILAALILVVGAFVAGFAVGGRGDGQRLVLGLGTAQRNVSAAIVVAAQNFGDDPEVVTMVMVVGAIALVILFATAGEVGRRGSARAQAGAVDAVHVAPDEVP